MDVTTRYRQAEELFDEVVAAVRPDRWDAPSACADWTVRDVAGHVTWGRWQMRAWATGEQYDEPAGAPGAPHPGVLAGDDPVTAWRTARDAANPALTPAALARTTTITGMGVVPVTAVVELLAVDTLTHAWDIAHGLGTSLSLPGELVEFASDWAHRTNLTRVPGFFDPELTPPDSTDDQTRLLAFLGRAAWQPVPA